MEPRSENGSRGDAPCAGAGAALAPAQVWAAAQRSPKDKRVSEQATESARVGNGRLSQLQGEPTSSGLADAQPPSPKGKAWTGQTKQRPAVRPRWNRQAEPSRKGTTSSTRLLSPKGSRPHPASLTLSHLPQRGRLGQDRQKSGLKAAQITGTGNQSDASASSRGRRRIISVCSSLSQRVSAPSAFSSRAGEHSAVSPSSRKSPSSRATSSPSA